MSYVPDSRILHGTPLAKAELYGKPHIGAFYANSSIKSHKMAGEANCAICGMRATNVHHCPPIGTARVFSLQTPTGVHVLKPALFAVCGTGNTGCHGEFHHWVIEARWAWEDDACAELWWGGVLLRRMEPHSPRLFEYGHWELYRFGELVREVRS